MVATSAPSEIAFAYAVNLTNKAAEASNTPVEATANQLLVLTTLNAHQLSKYIDMMKPIVASIPKPAFTPAPLAYVPPAGQYVINGKHYTIKKSKIHGGMLVYLGDWGGYVGALASPKCATVAEALSTAEKAKACVLAYAKETGKCGVCNTKLTDPKSIADGIGPVCKAKYS